MMLRSRAIGCSANWKSISRAASAPESYLLADIDEDLPELDALQFENAMLHPRIVF